MGYALPTEEPESSLVKGTVTGVGMNDGAMLVRTPRGIVRAERAAGCLLFFVSSLFLYRNNPLQKFFVALLISISSNILFSSVIESIISWRAWWSAFVS